MIVRNSPFPSQMQSAQNTQSPQNPKVDSAKGDSAPEKLSQNEQKVSEIKEQIDNGTYRIDINKTADKMAQDLLLDMKVYK